jgi:iron-sulfur cluster repair protein YtfE (RIC family)
VDTCCGGTLTLAEAARAAGMAANELRAAVEPALALRG